MIKNKLHPEFSLFILEKAIVALSLFMSVAAVRLAEDLGCLWIWHAGREHPFLTQSQGALHPCPDCSGHKLRVLVSPRGSWQRTRQILVPRQL